ncbi:hypothetical protein [Streptomyces xanthochromogenes]|uniref:hypothetical protein n=1 Tax=Streptomyces xanthochromogenes TaxID=67384 RepID=UPI001E5F0D46|nr:hypothetical protein [Streptomyces xanthochromogenes]
MTPTPDQTHRPDYPPKTPPPPKRPVESPRPEADSAIATRPRPRAVISNRRAANWTLENAPWSPAKAGRHILGQLEAWHYQTPASLADRLTGITELLARSALADGGRRVSLHLADQDQQALVMVLSHTPRRDVTSDALLHDIADLGASSCGADTASDGRRLWAVIDL